MPQFVLFEDNERKEFFKSIKEKIDSWEKFYPFFNISRTMFFNYLSGRYLLPIELFSKWKIISSFIPINIKIIKKPKYVPRELPLVKLDKKLAEIFGIVNGDGHIANFNYEICIICDSKEKEYINHIKNLFQNKLGITLTIFNEINKVKLRIYSKYLSNLFVNTYKMPQGNKIGKLRIPLEVKQSEKLLIPYLRGLFDTDGSFYLRRKKDPVVQITSADNIFLDEIKDSLKYLGFDVSKGNQRIFIYKKDQILKFFNEIKPANSKHLKKYHNYLNLERASS